jgi:NAD(P)-dependent dehydrogenase (short-subunit alcohol dehydrogenase family)
MKRVALVSGGNRGIGREVARQLAALDYAVVIGSRDLARGEEVARELGENVTARQLDVTDEESIVRCVASIADDPGRLDVLVNNAGVTGGGWSTSALDVDLDDVRKTLETNLFGAWRLTEEALPLMRKNGYGRIVNITRMLTAELADENILVNSVCPGWVRTDMGTQAARRSVEEGADTPVWLATLPDDGPRGGFFRDREPIPW